MLYSYSTALKLLSHFGFVEQNGSRTVEFHLSPTVLNQSFLTFLGGVLKRVECPIHNGVPSIFFRSYNEEDIAV